MEIKKSRSFITLIILILLFAPILGIIVFFFTSTIQYSFGHIFVRNYGKNNYPLITFESQIIGLHIEPTIENKHLFFYALEKIGFPELKHLLFIDFQEDAKQIMISPEEIHISFRPHAQLLFDEQDPTVLRRKIFTLSNVYTYMYGVLSKDKRKLTIPIYVNIDALKKFNNPLAISLSYNVLASLYLNFISIDSSQSTDPLYDFRQKVPPLDSPFIRISFKQSSLFNVLLSMVNIRRTQKTVFAAALGICGSNQTPVCQGQTQCGSIEYSEYRCVGGPYAGNSCNASGPSNQCGS